MGNNCCTTQDRDTEANLTICKSTNMNHFNSNYALELKWEVIYIQRKS